MSTNGDNNDNNDDEQQSSRGLRRRSDRNSSNNSNNKTQSDEEFERILDKKEDEERNYQRQEHHHHQRLDYDDQQRSQRTLSRRSSSHNYHNNSHHSRSHHHHQQRHRSGGGRNSNRYAPRSRSPPSADDVDREIIMAEQRLKAQKLLQKSLDQVQSLNTENFVMVPSKKATAFVNPHFKPKVDLPVMNVLPLNVAGKPLVSGTAINRLPLAAVQPVGAGQIILPGATPVLLPQRPLQSKVILSPMMVSPPAMVDGANTSRFVLQNNGTDVISKTGDEGKN